MTTNLLLGCVSTPTAPNRSTESDRWECQQTARIGLAPEPTAAQLAKLTPAEYEAYRKRAESERQIIGQRIDECLQRRNQAR